MTEREAGTRGRTLLLVGPLPPPYYGQSVAFRTLVGEVARAGVPHRVLDLAHGERSARKVGGFTAARLLEYGAILVRYAAMVPFGRGTVYVTIAQTRQGFARDFVIVWLAALFGRRQVLHLHGGNYGAFYAAQPRPLRWVIRHTLRRADRILVLGERLRGMFAFDPRLPPRVRVVPNGLPEDRLPQAGPKRLPAGKAEGPVCILFLSNLIESKGWMDVLAAVRRLRDRLGEGAVRCDFYGQFMDSPDDVTITSADDARRRFDAYVAEHGLQGCVAWHGVVDGDEKRDVLARSHFFVLPTRYMNEGQPISIIESIAYGNVVVSTDFRAIPDMVADGETGWLVPFGDAEAIADAVERTVRDPERYARMSRAAVKLYERRFTRQAHLDTLLPHLLDGGTTAPRLEGAPGTPARLR